MRAADEGSGAIIDPIDDGSGAAGCSYFAEIYCLDTKTCVDLPNNNFTCGCPVGALGDGIKLHLGGTGCRYPDCPAGFKEYNEACYKVTDATKPFPEARKKCQLYGGEIVSLLNMEEVIYVRDLLMTNGQHGKFWVGLSDSKLEGIFTWSDGSANTFNNWAENEPSAENAQEKDCVYISFELESDLKFYTASCNEDYQFACKMPQFPKMCSEGWISVGDKCVMSSRDPVTFYEAYLSCLIQGGDLPSVTSNQDMTDLLSVLGFTATHYWTGLEDGVLNTVDGQFAWTDGETDLKFAEDSLGSQLPDGNSTTCVYVKRDGAWGTAGCLEGHGYVCVKKPGVHNTCPEGSIRFEDKCYKPKPDDPKPGYDARQSCKEMGGDLVSIGSETEQNMIMHYLARNGLETDYWIGFMEGENGAYSWWDKTISAYTNWRQGSPDDPAPFNCVRMRMNYQYRWDDESCELPLPYLCEYYNTPCQRNEDCHGNGQCHMGQCRCKLGFSGDGNITCTDIDECAETPKPLCDVNAECVNNQGSYECICNEGFTGSGVTCINLRACTTNVDCHINGKCVQQDGLCKCKNGFEGDGKAVCDNINECANDLDDCHDNAFCTDEEGSFKCTCNEGFSGNGRECSDIPQSCDAIRILTPEEPSGLYLIDPDGPGGTAPFKVECEMRPDIGISIIPHQVDKEVKLPTTPRPESFIRYLRYSRASLDQARALVDISTFCYQTISFRCQGSTLPMNSMWTSYTGVYVRNWGSLTDRCDCGEIDGCRNPGAACNCDGSSNAEAVDDAVLMDKDLLPVFSLSLGGVPRTTSGWFTVGPLKCGPIQFDIPKDCDEAKFKYKLKKNSVIPIDIDGPGGDADGNLPPFLAHCDVESYPHVGVTEIPHDNGDNPGPGPDGPRGPQTPTEPGDNPLDYPVPLEPLLKLVKVSKFCSQEMEYSCEMSRLLSAGAYYAYWSSVEGQRMNYWGGGMRQEHSCGCGVTNSCDSPDVKCNCDITDGKPRKDIGFIYDKEDLPVGSVTLNDLGEGKKAEYYVGWLQCGPAPFGIEPSCHWWRQRGYDYTYTYMIDPDGPVPRGLEGTPVASINVDPFPVSCEMLSDPDIGVTVIGHGEEGPTDITPDEDIPIEYTEATLPQVTAAVDRSSYCMQTISYTCQDSAIHLNGENVAFWSNRDGDRRLYFDGTDGDQCACGPEGACDGGAGVKCQCDLKDGQLRNDNGTIHNKDDLPMTAIHFGDVENAAVARLDLGRIRCFELYPTCYHLYLHHGDLYGRHRPKNGRYTIDPDLIYGVNPFWVECVFPLKTILPVTAGNDGTIEDTPQNPNPQYDNPASSCTPLKYVHADTPQLRALTVVAGFCSQYARYSCQNAPFTTHSHWVNREGATMPGFAGNAGGQECGCGQTDRCDGGVTDACNCDAGDGSSHMDHGLFIDKSLLPVSEMCLGLTDTPDVIKTAGFHMGELMCAPWQIGIEEDCQRRRDRGDRVTETWLIDPDGKGGVPPFPAYCIMHDEPPFGITVITHNDEVCQDIPAEGATLSFTYNSVSYEQLQALRVASVYCTQEMEYNCRNADLTLDDLHGWYSIEGAKVVYWAGNTGGTGCEGDACLCNTHDNIQKIDGGMLLDKNDLPVDKVNMAALAGNGSRCLDVDSFMCYTVYKNCHEILMRGETWNPNENDRYAIDPDGPSGVDIFTAKCDFETEPGMGISWIPVSEGNGGDVPTDGADVPVAYDDADYPQIQELTKTSAFCSQDLKYHCQNLPLINDFDPRFSYFKDGFGLDSPNWAGADHTDIVGCACTLLRMCPVNHTCVCDDGTAKIYTEGGFLTNKDKLPVTAVVTGGAGEGSQGSYTVGDLACAPRPFNLPKDCVEAKKQGYTTGAVRILPDPDFDSFLVHCDMDRLSGDGAVTILTPDLDPRTPAPSTGDIPVTYLQASLDQVKAVVEGSYFCLQLVKLDCRATQFIGKDPENNGFIGGDGLLKTYFGRGVEAREECSCGAENKCGGHDGKRLIRNRDCNCDARDNEWRADAGVISKKNDLPIQAVRFSLGDNENATAYLTLGRMMCANRPFDVNECTLNYHDCHEKANCINKNYRFLCSCQKGFQAKGRKDDVVANGRQCPDDNECNLGVCPFTADCENTYGSFICHCKDGFRKVGPTECEDIDECAEGTDNCDSKAKCRNTFGSFYCTCKDGYRGEGTEGTCEEIGSCKCFGDPHCLSYDRRWLHFQGGCSYVMAQDGCQDGAPLYAPSFKVIQKNWHDFGGTTTEGSWVKEIIVLVYGLEIRLRQDKVVFVDGIKLLRLPAQPSPEHQDLNIKHSARYVHLTTEFGLEVKWTGSTKVEVLLPESFKNQTCGLCGNFNGLAEDDWIIGPQCPTAGFGQITDNYNIFGNSWTYNNPAEPECTVDCNMGFDEPCDEATNAEALRECSLLLDMEGRFKDCLKEFTQQEFDEQLFACTYDMCRTQNDIHVAICQYAEALAQRCSDDMKTPVINWRSNDFCPVACGEGQLYSSCGDPCQPSCNQTMSQVNCAADTCVEVCECEPGLVMDGDRCIPQEQCGCSMDGLYFSVGDRIVLEDCQKQCICRGPMQAMDCIPLSCHYNGTCQVEEGVLDCYCNEGYQGPGDVCDDIDECQADEYPCDPNASCENTDGSYICTCNEGYRGDGHTCDDIDECVEETDDCDQNANCTNNPGSYKCYCNQGYKKNAEDVCEDIDECSSGRNQCDRQTTNCTNQPGTYSCDCKDGYDPVDDFTCKDRDECQLGEDDCHEDADCDNIPGGFTCTCKPGYLGDGKVSCLNYDECAHEDWNECNSHANCTDTIGSYTCTCDEGYRGDGRVCEEIDECFEDRVGTGCVLDGDGGKCINLPGTFRCTCRPGYSGDGVVADEGCEDVNECTRPGAPACGRYSNCTNFPGGYDCECIEGYMSPTGDGKNCEEIPTCTDDTVVCQENEICKDTETGPVCECKEGYRRMQDQSCQDINECQEDATLCDGVYQYCDNKPGYYTCECQDGYAMNAAGECEDVDECEEELHACVATGAHCVNEEGTYDCECDTGYRRVGVEGGVTCDDINECLEELDECDENADCSNTIGSYTCACKDRYFGNGKKCDEFSECYNGESDCSPNADCQQLAEGSQCVCHLGYEGDGYTCDNVDECDRNTHDCSANAICVDTQGGFQCLCKTGYSGHCDACKDIDECAVGLAECDKDHGECVNTLGSFYCQCEDGYSGDGTECRDANECLLGTANCWEHSTCKNFKGGFECLCDAGYTLQTENDTSVCNDVDECTTSQNLCDLNADCVNTDGSYKCVCQTGYFGDGYSCEPEDPNKCAGKDCDPMADCMEDAEGQKSCICGPGYQGIGYISNGLPGCTQLDPCEYKVCDVNADCVVVNQQAICYCRYDQGYYGDGLECDRVDPCDDVTACGPDAECQAVNDSHVCTCWEGFVLVDDYECVDVNECERPIPVCYSHSTCTNVPGSYICTCYEGYYYNEPTDSCKDVDECDLGKDDCDTQGRATCTNTEGGYTCACLEPTYEGDGRTCTEVSEPDCDLQCPDDQYCRIVEGTGVCVCKTGFTQSVGDNGIICTDIPECNDNSTCHTNAVCIEQSPGYVCQCEDGYQGNGLVCTDDNECDTGNNNCHEKAVCENLDGSFQCVCKPGYTGNGVVCTLIPAEDDICLCGQYGICDSETGVCYCKRGFKFNSEAEFDRCEDDNDCLYPDRCHAAAVCIDAVGGWRCECPDGMEGDGFEYCDENECVNGKAQCSPFATCTNTIGAFICECNEGYVGTGELCRPISDPCGAQEFGCGVNAFCNNVDGEAECKCLYGYQGDGEWCTDVNECVEEGELAHECGETAICSNNEGGYTCQCRPGFILENGRDCKDIDECEDDNQNDCSPYANCYNEIGGYTCECFEDYVGDGRQCRPDDTCDKVGGCDENAECNGVPNGGYRCQCSPGYQGDGYFCDDIDECATNTTNCHSLAKCENIDGSYQCNCQTGYTGDGVFCIDFDECIRPETNDCGVNAICVNSEGSYDCECQPGFEPTGEDQCSDVNECDDPATNECHEAATCVNRAGGYSCKCWDGYYGNGVVCQDINECETGFANCSANTLCNNRPGSFTCGCLRGFLPDEEDCEDVDECENPQMNDCDLNADCENNEGSYVCTCKEGYTGNGRICFEPDPCDQVGACHEDATCTNVDGEAECECVGDLFGDGIIICEVPNECQDGSADCDVNANCTDTAEGYECACLPGYQGDGKNCTDINECDPTTPQGGGHTCDTANGQACVNLPPPQRFTCTCTAEDQENGECGDPNQCATGDNDCHENADCENKNPGYVCVCQEGYEGDGVSCTDVDECEQGTDTCDEFFDCVNVEGGTNCTCAEGFVLSTAEQKCIDVDECQDENECDEDAICVNELGSYDCTCLHGFTGDGKTCDDIDECVTGEDPCHQYAECTNTPGSCECTCALGFTGDGVHCEELDTCDQSLNVICQPNAYCEQGVGDTYRCLCKTGYETDASGLNCVDINECALEEKRCDDHALCENTNGGYKCICKLGYRGNGQICEDVDECDFNEHTCDREFGKCVNIEGSYSCECRPGYTGDGRSCTQLDECQTPDHECATSAKCIDTVGSYTCQCLPGFRGNGRECTDINECGEDRDLCHALAECENMPGTYVCQCPSGYEGNGYNCTDVNECLLDNGDCGENCDCINIPGSRICRCHEGYKRVGDVCLDIDECVEEDKDAECEEKKATCVNMEGGYVCECEEGYRFNAAGVCEDINECLEGDEGSGGICGSGSTCQNSPGSCLCACRIGYEVPGGAACGGCVDVDECTSEEFPHNCGDDRKCQNNDPGYECLCKDGYEVSDEGECTDINECLELDDLGQPRCQPGDCENNEGSYVCVCPYGYEFLDGICKNIDECLLPPQAELADECVNADCVDETPGYRCDCLPGYVKEDGSEKTCVDKDECTNPEQCGPHGECLNVPGSFVCECFDGYRWDGVTCSDKNECTDVNRPNICGTSTAGECTNIEGNYTCTCKQGYTLKDRKCQDIDECKEGEIEELCSENAVCINTLGSYKCECPPGYTTEGVKCININECGVQEGPCDVNADCADTPGSFECTCKEGYAGNGRVCQPICAPGVCHPLQECSVVEERAVCSCMCRGPECLNDGLVCGDDGKTYVSDTERLIQACREQKEIRRRYRGPCLPSCDDVVCAAGKHCVQKTTGPVCECEQCTPEDWLTGIVCGVSGREYPTMCLYIQAQCIDELNDPISHVGECSTKEDCKYEQWGAWSPCDVTCGGGLRQRTRGIFREAQGGGAPCDTLEQESFCFAGPCLDDVCANKTCSRPAQFCVVVDGEAECHCPSCEYEPTEHVCGVLGDTVVSAPNLCSLERSACVQDKLYNVLHPGACSSDEPNEPLECSMMPLFTRVENQYGCVSRDPIQINECRGGCSQGEYYCCEPDETRVMLEQFLCNNGTQLRYSQVEGIISCKCEKNQKRVLNFPDL